MPSGLPSPESLQNQTVRGFSIDTSIFRGLGFRFHEGQLAVLHQQVPRWLTLYTSDVVLRETERQAVQQGNEAIAKLKDSVARVSKLLEGDLNDVRKTLDNLALEERATKVAKARFRDFAISLRGSMVDLTEVSSEKLFEAYFSNHPPFASSGDKKSEFPDAASLFGIEALAAKEKAQIILVSKDKGWHEYAANSERLYCVDSVESLASLFESTSPVANELKAKIVALIKSDDEAFLVSVQRKLTEAINSVFWYADGYSDAPNITVDISIHGADVLNVHLKEQSVRLWTHTEDARSCVVEVEANVDCDFEYTAQFDTYNPVLDEVSELGDETRHHRESVSLALLMTLEGDLKSDATNHWNMEVSVADPTVQVDFGATEPDWSLHSYEE